MEYIIVQAGGKGRRMEMLTHNKPKALVPVENLPMLFHLFRKYPDKHFIVIGDYKYEVLERYLAAFGSDYDYTLLRAQGQGTCAGLRQALALVPEGHPFLLIWCDLILGKDFQFPESQHNLVGIAKDFTCRWQYTQGGFREEKSEQQGVAGAFVFQDKACLLAGDGVPAAGEFVRYLSEHPEITFEEAPLRGTREYGLFKDWSKLPKMRCRPFNTLRVDGDRVYKAGIDEQGRKLGLREVNWYKQIAQKDFRNIPHIYSYEPLCMELIDGKNIYEYTYLPLERKRVILSQIIACLQQVHSLAAVPADSASFYEAYIDKTFKRLAKVQELVPFAKDKFVKVNGRSCHNVFFCRDVIERAVQRYMPDKFVFIHGDCTFSNMMLRHDEEPVLIDPRGYFGHTEIYGDAAYDWVKLYYSLVSNYDQFNLKRFTLDIQADGVQLDIASSSWETLEPEFFQLLEGEVTEQQMKLLLALTWLSLTTYAWEDYDSICGAFYYGLWWLEEALQLESAYDRYFAANMTEMESALQSVPKAAFEALLDDCETTLRQPGQKIIVSGLGKNVPIGEKFVGTLLSLGLNANFLHTDSALHGDLGMVRPGDLVILLSKSGATEESVVLARHLQQRQGVTLWLLTFRQESELASLIPKQLVLHLEQEGDLWNIMPNNSTTLNLIVLQTVAVEMARRLGLDLHRDFQPNHPGGAIGARLKFGEEG